MGSVPTRIVETQVTDPNRRSEPSARRTVRRRWWLLLLGVGGVLALLVLAPSLGDVPFVRRWILRQIAGPVRGTLEAEHLRWHWFEPLSVQGLTLKAPDGSTVIRVPRLSGDTELWSALIHPGSLGNYRVEQPNVHLVLHDRGSNLADALAGSIDGSPPRLPDWEKAALQRVALTAEIVGGTLTFQRHAQAQAWTTGDLNMWIGLQPKPSRASSPYLTVREGTLLDHVEITPAITRDLLQFMAPILSQATNLDGSFSLATTGAVFPLDDLGAGYCHGSLTIHSIRATPGPLLQEFAKRFARTPALTLVDESRVQFVLQDHAVSHEGLCFQLAGLEVQSAGQVMLDRSIDLLVRFRLPRELPWIEDRGLEGLASRLAGHEVSLPIKGTLGQPRIDMAAFATTELADHPLLTGLLSSSPELALELRQAMERWKQRWNEPQPEGTFAPNLRSRLRQRLRGLLDERVRGNAESRASEEPD